MSIMAGIDGPLYSVKQGNLVFNPDGSILVLPFGLTGNTGNDDVQINLAHSLGNDIRLGPWAYNMAAGIPVPWPNSMKGIPGATLLNYSGNGSAVFLQDATDPQEIGIGDSHHMAPEISGIIIDGSGAGANAIGLDIQEMSGGATIKSQIRNFTGANATAVRIANNTYSTNSLDGRIATTNCQLGVLFTALASEQALERINLNILVEMVGSGQTGIQLANGASLYDSILDWHFLAQDNSVAAIVWGTTSVIQECIIKWRGEFGSGQSGGTCTTIDFTGSPANTGMKNCTGVMAWPGPYVDSNVSSQSLALHGVINGDNALLKAQIAPQYAGYGNSQISSPGPQPTASGAAVNNNQNVPAYVIINGGNVTGITTTDQSGTLNYTWPAGSPFVPVPAGGAITPTYTSKPGLVWVPAG